MKSLRSSYRPCLLALSILAANAITVAHAGPVAVARFDPSATVPAVRWQPIDISFTATPPAGTNPFDIPFEAILTGPDGMKMTVPGFFDGNDRFVVRFTPPVAGQWSFATTSALEPLNRHTGRIAAAAAPAGQHGPIVVRTDKPRQFAYADNTSYFPIAFEADWLFALDAENAADIPKTRTLLTQLADNGFNQIILNVFAYDVVWRRDPNLDPQYDYGKPRVFPFGGDNIKPQHGTLSVEFFQRFDRVIAELDRLGLVAHVMIYVWNKEVTWPAPDSPDDNRYFDYVVKRYQAFPNLIWDISKEATGYSHNDKAYITRRIERLRALDAHHRLVTVHDYGYCNAFPQTVDFISVQNWKSELWSIMMDIAARHPRKPALNIEHGGYERGPFHVFTGGYLDPEVLLGRAYLCVFAGALPSYYWQDAAWNVVIHDPAALPERDRPRLSYYRHMATLVQRANLAELEPTPKFSNVGYCLSNSRDRYVFFLPRGTSAINLHLGEPKEPLHEATWFNPLTGEFSPAKPPANRSGQTYSPPNDVQPWVLIVGTSKK